MPVVNQQNPNKPVVSGNPVDRIRAVTSIPHDQITMVIYGETKTGKTRLLASFPKPVLIIATEDGTDSIANVEGVDIVRITHTDEIRLLVAHANKKPYKTCGLDNASQAQQMRLCEMLGMNHVPLQMERGVMANIDNQQYALETKQALNEMFKFKGHTVFLAHEKDQNSEQRGDAIKPRIMASLSRSVADWLNGMCSHICQTFIRERMVMQELIEGDPQPVGTGEGEYCLRTGSHSIYKAGLRVPVGAKVPSYIVNPTFEKIYTIIQGKYKEEQKKV